jgi:hypothetical protein
MGTVPRERQAEPAETAFNDHDTSLGDALHPMRVLSHGDRTISNNCGSFAGKPQLFADDRADLSRAEAV